MKNRREGEGEAEPQAQGEEKKSERREREREDEREREGERVILMSHQKAPIAEWRDTKSKKAKRRNAGRERERMRRKISLQHETEITINTCPLGVGNTLCCGRINGQGRKETLRVDTIEAVRRKRTIVTAKKEKERE